MKRKLGFAFSERIYSTRIIHSKEMKSTPRDFRARLFLFQAVLAIAFLVLFFQLIKLTVVEGNYYAGLASQNRIKENIYPAPRGIIKDRNGEVLVQNKPGYLIQSDCDQKPCFKKITHEEALKLEVASDKPFKTVEIIREYPETTAFSHILGTTGAVAEEEIGKTHCQKILSYEDELGRSGIEEAFDCLLQGKSGKELVETDAKGQTIRVLSKVEPKPGETIITSLDKKLQLAAQKLLAGKIGTVIVHKPQTGEVLTMYSSPSYNISQFAEGISQKDYESLLNDTDKPLLNRAISGLYPPGSTYKPIIAAAALEEKKIDQNTIVEDTGIITIGEFSFANWYFTQYGKKEGSVNVITGLKRSNDIYFYKIGEILGVDKIAQWSRKFKLGQKLGIEITGEEEGLVPDTVWKEKFKGEKWYLGDTYHLAIGQGDLLVTPLQLAFASGAFGNRGIICKPTLLKTDTCQKITEKLVSSKTLDIVRNGMIEVCSEGGTAYPFFDFKINENKVEVACKTGTAEFGPQANGQNKTHAWFSAFSPPVDPEIAVTVLVEQGGEGSAVAAPIAKEIFNQWFTDK